MDYWQYIDFHGIATLDKGIVEQLRKYLDEKQEQLHLSYVGAIHTFPMDLHPPIQPAVDEDVRGRFVDQLESFSKRIHHIKDNPSAIVSFEDWKIAAEHISRGLWSYVELLEGAVVELFQQLGQVGFEKWKPELIETVGMVKTELMQRLEELSWVIKHTEKELRNYRSICQTKLSGWQKLKATLTSHNAILDRKIIENVWKSEKYLGFHYQTFVHRFEEFTQLNATIEQGLKKFDSYPVLLSINNDSLNKFKKIYHYLKIWQMNQKAKALPDREIVRAIRDSISDEKAFQLFQHYYRALKSSLFEKSRKLKTEMQGSAIISKLHLQQMLHIFLLELHSLAVTVAKYREFLIQTDPNPYVRTRWGFAEWVLGPEPVICNQLKQLVYEIEALDLLYEQFKKAVDEQVDSRTIDTIHSEIQKTLHEMGQPLTSQSMMKVRAEHVLSLIAQLNELGSSDPGIVNYIGQVFARALRADWKHHVMHDIPQFHQLYEIHQGILGHIEDRNHSNRLHKFKHHTHQIEQWIKEKDTQKHAQEISFDINDIKECLQDYLSYVQRLSMDPAVDSREKALQIIQLVSNQLLEYRYQFGHFFHHLKMNNPDEKMIRNQFLFVDQYFEAVENKLHEMKGLDWSLLE